MLKNSVSRVDNDEIQSTSIGTLFRRFRSIKKKNEKYFQSDALTAQVKDFVSKNVPKHSEFCELFSVHKADFTLMNVIIFVFSLN